MSSSPGKYTVLVDDNYNYMDESSRHSAGSFDTLEAAIVACRRVVDGCLEDCYEKGMTADQLYGKYKMFGEDPFIVCEGRSDVPFSAWDYAKQRAAEICGKPVKPEGAS